MTGNILTNAAPFGEQLAAYAEEVRRTVPEVPKSGLEWALGQKDLVRREGTWIEFGVNEGGTLNAIAPYRDDAVLWGFDSCRGLPEKWNADHPKGMFAMARPPLPPDGVNLVVGWFKDTLPAFEPAEPVTFVHLDCDLYSSAVTVLAWLCGIQRDDGPLRYVGARVRIGAVIVFDDFLTKPYDNGVLRAFFESPLRERVELIARPKGSDVLVGRVRS